MKIPHQTRRHLIQDAARRMAVKYGLVGITHEITADACLYETSAATVRRFYPTLDELYRAAASHPKATKSVRDEAVAAGLS